MKGRGPRLKVNGRTVRGIAERPEAMAAAPPLPAHESDVRHRGGADHLDVLIADRSTVQTVKQTLAAPEEDGHDRQVQLVDETGAQVLLDRRYAAPQADVGASRRLECPRQRRLDPIGDEVERRS